MLTTTHLSGQAMRITTMDCVIPATRLHLDSYRQRFARNIAYMLKKALE